MKSGEIWQNTCTGRKTDEPCVAPEGKISVTNHHHHLRCHTRCIVHNSLKNGHLLPSTYIHTYIQTGSSKTLLRTLQNLLPSNRQPRFTPHQHTTSLNTETKLQYSVPPCQHFPFHLPPFTPTPAPAHASPSHSAFLPPPYPSRTTTPTIPKPPANTTLRTHPVAVKKNKKREKKR